MVRCAPSRRFTPVGGAEQSMLRSARVASARPPAPSCPRSARALGSRPFASSHAAHASGGSRGSHGSSAAGAAASAEQLQRSTKRTRSHVPRPRRPVPRTDSSRRPRPARKPQHPHSELRHALHTSCTRPPETTPLTCAAAAKRRRQMDAEWHRNTTLGPPPPPGNMTWNMTWEERCQCHFCSEYADDEMMDDCGEVCTSVLCDAQHLEKNVGHYRHVHFRYRHRHSHSCRTPS